MKHDPIPEPFPDEFGIGQAKVAEHRAAIAMEEMSKFARDAFSTGYVNPEWRAMSRRVFARNRAQYERAQAILGVLQ